jgi:hypothetical protein
VANEVVAHYLDGRVIKGVSLDVDPGRPSCHVRSPDGKVTEVKLAQLKALYFVKSLAGDPAPRRSTIRPADARGRGAFRIAITFADGRTLVNSPCVPAGPAVLLHPAGRCGEQQRPGAGELAAVRA